MSNEYADIFVWLYDFLFAQSDGDEEFFRYCIEQKNDGTALEIGSGTGRLLLKYLQEGLAVEGVEPSRMMIELCKRKAISNKLEPVVHAQYMQELMLSKHYTTIYIPRCAFQLIVDRHSAQQALKKMYDHLVPGGKLLIPLFIPWSRDMANRVWRLRCSQYIAKSDVAHYQELSHDLMREHIYDCQIIVSESIHDNWFDQSEEQQLKIELIYDHGLHKTYMQTTHMRWYHRFEFEDMLRVAGFHDVTIYDGYTHIPASDGTSLFVWQAIK